MLTVHSCLQQSTGLICTFQASSLFSQPCREAAVAPNMASIIEENKYLKWDFCENKPTCKTKQACLPVQINSASAPTTDLSRHETHWTANECQAAQM